MTIDRGIQYLRLLTFQERIQKIGREIEERIKEVGLEQAGDEFSARAHEDLNRLSNELAERREDAEYLRACRAIDRIRKRVQNPKVFAHLLLGEHPYGLDTTHPLRVHGYRVKAIRAERTYRSYGLTGVAKFLRYLRERHARTSECGVLIIEEFTLGSKNQDTLAFLIEKADEIAVRGRNNLSHFDDVCAEAAVMLQASENATPFTGEL
jgi:hypothetical protein